MRERAKDPASSSSSDQLATILDPSNALGDLPFRCFARLAGSVDEIEYLANQVANVSHLVHDLADTVSEEIINGQAQATLLKLKSLRKAQAKTDKKLKALEQSQKTTEINVSTTKDDLVCQVEDLQLDLFNFCQNLEATKASKIETGDRISFLEDKFDGIQELLIKTSKRLDVLELSRSNPNGRLPCVEQDLKTSAAKSKQNVTGAGKPKNLESFQTNPILVDHAVVSHPLYAKDGDQIVSLRLTSDKGQLRIEAPGLGCMSVKLLLDNKPVAVVGPLGMTEVAPPVLVPTSLIPSELLMVMPQIRQEYNSYLRIKNLTQIIVNFHSHSIYMDVALNSKIRLVADAVAYIAHVPASSIVLKCGGTVIDLDSKMSEIEGPDVHHYIATAVLREGSNLDGLIPNFDVRCAAVGARILSMPSLKGRLPLLPSRIGLEGAGFNSIESNNCFFDNHHVVQSKGFRPNTPCDPNALWAIIGARQIAAKASALGSKQQIKSCPSFAASTVNDGTTLINPTSIAQHVAHVAHTPSKQSSSDSLFSASPLHGTHMTNDENAAIAKAKNAIRLLNISNSKDLADNVENLDQDHPKGNTKSDLRSQRKALINRCSGPFSAEEIAARIAAYDSKPAFMNPFNDWRMRNGIATPKRDGTSLPKEQNDAQHINDLSAEGAATNVTNLTENLALHTLSGYNEYQNIMSAEASSRPKTLFKWLDNRAGELSDHPDEV